MSTFDNIPCNRCLRGGGVQPYKSVPPNLTKTKSAQAPGRSTAFPLFPAFIARCLCGFALCGFSFSVNPLRGSRTLGPAPMGFSGGLFERLRGAPGLHGHDEYTGHKARHVTGHRAVTNRANNPGGRRVFASAWPTRSENISMSEDTMNTRQTSYDRHGHRACHNYTPGLRQGLARLMDGGRWRGGLRRALGVAALLGPLAAGALIATAPPAHAAETNCSSITVSPDMFGDTIRFLQIDLVKSFEPTNKINNDKCAVGNWVPGDYSDSRINGYIPEGQGPGAYVFLPDEAPIDHIANGVKLFFYSSRGAFSKLTITALSCGAATASGTSGTVGQVTWNGTGTCSLRARARFNSIAIELAADLEHLSNGYQLTNARLTTLDPEIEVTGNSQDIQSGDNTPRTEDNTDYGQVVIGTSTLKTFKVSNTGSSSLSVRATINPVSPATARNFNINGSPSFVVPPNGSRDVTIDIRPDKAGVVRGTVSLATNDPDENPFTFTIQGTGVLPPTTTTITGVNPPSPTTVGQDYTVSVKVAPSGSATGTPSGTVTVSDGSGGRTCTATLNAQGEGSCTISGAPAGNYNLTAMYSGDSQFAGGTSAQRAHEVITKPTLAVSIDVQPQPVAVQQVATVTVTLTKPTGVRADIDGTPAIRLTGAVAARLTANTCSRPTINRTATNNTATATCIFGATTLGSGRVEVTYSGGNNYAAISTPVTEDFTVAPAKEDVELVLVSGPDNEAELVPTTLANQATVGFAYTAYVRVQKTASKDAVTAGTLTVRLGNTDLTCSARNPNNGIYACTIPGASISRRAGTTLTLRASYDPGTAAFNPVSNANLTGIPAKAATTLIEFWDRGTGRSDTATAAAGGPFIVRVRVRMTDSKRGTTPVLVPATAGRVTLSGGKIRFTRGQGCNYSGGGVYTCEVTAPNTAGDVNLTATFTDRNNPKDYQDSTTDGNPPNGGALTLTVTPAPKADVELKLVESRTSAKELTTGSNNNLKATVGFAYSAYVRVQEQGGSNTAVTEGTLTVKLGNTDLTCTANTPNNGIYACTISAAQITEAGTLVLKAAYNPGTAAFNPETEDLSLPVRAPTTSIRFFDTNQRQQITTATATATAGAPFTVHVQVSARTTGRNGRSSSVSVPSGAGDVRLTEPGKKQGKINVACTYERAGIYKCDATAPTTGPVTLNATFTGKVGRDTTKDYQDSATATSGSGPSLTLNLNPAPKTDVELKLVESGTSAKELTTGSSDNLKAAVGLNYEAYVRVQQTTAGNAAVTEGSVSITHIGGTALSPAIDCDALTRVTGVDDGIAFCGIPKSQITEAGTLVLKAAYNPGTAAFNPETEDLSLPVRALTTFIAFVDGSGQTTNSATATAGAPFTVRVGVQADTTNRVGRVLSLDVPSGAGDVTLRGTGITTNKQGQGCTYERAGIYKCDATAPTTGPVTLNATFTGKVGRDTTKDYQDSATATSGSGPSLTLNLNPAPKKDVALKFVRSATSTTDLDTGDTTRQPTVGVDYDVFVYVENATQAEARAGTMTLGRRPCNAPSGNEVAFTCPVPGRLITQAGGTLSQIASYTPGPGLNRPPNVRLTITIKPAVATPDVEIVSIKRKTPTGQYVVKSGRVTFELTFNQAVEVEAAAYAASDSNRVTVSNGGIFIATNSGLRNGNHVATVGFNINQVATDGDLHLDIIDPKKITAVSDRNKTLTQQSITNLLAPGAGNDNYQIYTIDGTAPTIRTVEFFRVQQGGTVTGPATNTAEPGHNIRMVVTFSEPMRDTPVPTVTLPTNNPGTPNGFTAVTLAPVSGDNTKFSADISVPSGITSDDYTFTVDANGALDRAGNPATGTPTATLKVAPARQASGVVGTVATFVESDNFGASPLTSPQDEVPANVDYRAYVKVATNPGNSAVTTGTVTLTGAGQGITCNDSSPKNGVFECEVPQDRITRGAQLSLIAQFTGGGGAYSDSPRSSPLILNVVDAPRITKIERWNTTNDQAVTNPLTNAASVTWRVTFDKAVTIGVRAFGVDNNTVANNTGLTYRNASTNSPPYTLDVKATTINNREGEVGLTVDPTKISLASDTNIKLVATMPTGADNEKYTVDRKAPTIASVEFFRVQGSTVTGPATNTAEPGHNIRMVVTFSEDMRDTPVPTVTPPNGFPQVTLAPVVSGVATQFETNDFAVPQGINDQDYTFTVNANGALDRAGNPATGTQTAILTVTPAGTGATKPGQDPQLADPSIAVAVDYDLSTTVPDGSPPTLSNTNKRIAVIATVSGTSAVPMLQTDGTVTFTGLPTNANIVGRQNCNAVALAGTGTGGSFTATCTFTPIAGTLAGTYKVTAEFVPAVSTKFNSADDTVDVVLNAGQPTVSKAPQNNRLVLRADPPQGKNPPQREITFDDKTFGAPQAGAGGQLGKITFDVVDKNTGKPPQGKGPGPNNGWSDIPYNQQPAAKALLRRGVYLVTMKITQSAPGGQTGQQGRASAPAPAPQQQFTQDFTLQIVAPAGATVPAPTTGKGKIVVQLDTNGGGDGLQAHAFTATPGLGSLGTGFTLTTTKTRTSDTKDSGDLDPNTYTITAADFAGTDYSLSDVGCVVTGTGGSTGTPTASDRKVEVVLNANDIVTCVFSAAYAPKASVATAEKTRQMVADYLGDRNAMLLANGVNMDSRLSRLRPGGNGRSGQVGGTLSVNLGQSEDATASAFSMNLRTSLPGDVSITDDTITFAVSATRLARSGLFGADIYDDDDVVSGDTGDVVDGAVGPQMRWDVWIEGRLSRFDSGNSKDGTLGVVYLGADYLITPNMLIGLMTQYDWLGKDYDTNGRVKGHGWMVGPYAAARFGEALYLDVQARWGRSSNDITPLGTYTDTFKTTRWYVSGKLSGDFSYGDWTIRPGISVQYLSEKQKAYTDSQGNAIAGQTVSEGDVRVGPRLAYTYGLGDGGALIPWAEFEGVYTFGSKGKFSKGTYASDIHGLSGSVEAGFDWRLPAGAMFSLSGSYDGIGSGSKSYGARARIDIPF